MSLTTRSGIAADPNCVAFCEVDTLTGFANNDPVGAVPDQSGWVAGVGQTKQFQMGTAANKPLYLTNQRNGLPALSFDGVNDYLESSPRNLTTATMVLVRKLSSAGTGANKVQMICSAGAGSGLGLYQTSAGPPGKHGAYLRGVVAIPSTTNTTTNWEVVVLACGNSPGSAGNTRMWVDGAQIISTTDDMATSGSVGSFFVGKDDSGTLMSGAMLVGAWVLFDRQLSAGDVADITGYFQGIWGDLPGTPTGLDVVDETGTSLDFEWSAPVAGGTVSSYQVRIDGGAASTATSPHTFSGLSPGTMHTLEVRAVGPGGNGAWASIAGTTLDVPGEPEDVAAVDVGFDSIDLEWSPPSTGGDVDSYEVRIDGGTPTAATSPHTFDGLTPGTTYSLEVRAVGPGGESDWVEVEVDTLDDTVTARWHADVRIGPLSWSIDYADPADPDGANPLAGASFSWAAPDDVGWPPRPYEQEPDTLTLRIHATDADDVDAVRRLDVVRFAFTPEGYGLSHPLVDFAGRITSTPKITRHPTGVVLEVTAVDHRLALQQVTIFGRQESDGGAGYNGETDEGQWNVGTEGYDARALIQGVPDGVTLPVVGLVAWNGVDEWINAALGVPTIPSDPNPDPPYGLPWIDFPIDIFDGEDVSDVDLVYPVPLIQFEYGSDLVTLHDVYSSLTVYPWPTFDDDGNLTGFRFVDPHPNGLDYTATVVDAAKVLGGVEWRRAVHPDWVEVKHQSIPSDPTSSVWTRYTTGQEAEPWPEDEIPENVRRLVAPHAVSPDAPHSGFNLLGFVQEVRTATWFPFKADVLADLDPACVDGWFNYPERISKVVQIQGIEDARHPRDDLDVGPDDEFAGRLTRATLTIAARGRWSVQARFRPRLPATVLDDLYPE